MATLVLSTVGTVLGGPIGGAIGAFVGQSFDEQLLAPASRGPRLGDLSVQTSSYGTQIPRIYGAMRVAGSVIWATDLAESDQTTGAKGQPDVTYSYSVSFAVALSSRPVKAIKRIWADGKLLRGAEGDFKVSTTFRFYDGDEDQDIDPLIASIEGIANTPAHRGLALAVFENLELADFGNRIPFLTFEVVADDEPPITGEILADCSAGAIVCNDDRQVVGYAAYGRSIRAAAEPIVSTYDIRLFDDGTQVRSPIDDAPVSVSADEFGNSADNRQAPRLERTQAPVSALPATLRLSYYDPDRDYQTGEARASVGEQAGNEAQLEVAAVLSAGDAKALAQQALARQWASRDKLTLRLPPNRTAIEPGARLDLPLNPGSWTVDKCTVDSFVTVVELYPSWRPAAILLADTGRVVGDPDIVEQGVALALFETPTLPGNIADGPTVFLAATSAGAGWKRRSVAVTFGNNVVSIPLARRKSVLGEAITMLAAAGPWLIDNMNSVEVELIDADQWLTSCDDDALATGVNLALLGDELLQFGSAVSLGGGRFRLSRLLRARGGTELAMNGHVAGEVFCLIEPASLRSIMVPPWAIGGAVTATDRNGQSSSIILRGQSVRPISPVELSAQMKADGSLAVSWVRRSRSGSAWIDEVDAPLEEPLEQYRIMVSGAAGTTELTSASPALTVDAAELSILGPGPATVDVRQIGNWAASAPAQANVTLP